MVDPGPPISTPPPRFVTNLFLVESCVRLVAVAQLAEHRIVAPKVAGSIPVGHPL